MTGFVVAYREAAEHPLFKGHADRLGAWLWLLMKAAWKPTKFDVNGKVVTVKRGQLSVSIRHLGEAWGWSKSSTDRFLTRLKTETMIETESGTGRLLITICNYDKYQDISDIHGTATGTQSGTAAGQQRDIKEQGNKETIDKEPNGSSSKRVRVFPKPDGIEQSIWNDYLEIRKAKRAPVSATALAIVEREAVKAGWSLNDALAECVARGWQGFKAEWVTKNGTEFNSNRTEPALNPVAEAIVARRAERAGREPQFFEPDARSWAE
jgi:hypothetical protein